MGRDISELASYMQALAVDLLADCAIAGIPCTVEDTGRDLAQQQINLAKGTSWTQSSKHLPQPPEGKSEAIDIVPKAILGKNDPGWDPGDPLWTQIGLIGENLGLEWGGRWTHLNNGHGDPGHFQYIHKPDLSVDLRSETVGDA